MTVTIDGTTGVAVPLGSVSAPGVSNTTSSTTGIYNPTGTTLGIATNGVNAVYVDASQNVGIGTTSPGQRLDLGGGSLMLYNSTGTQKVYLYRASATNYSSIGTDSSAGGITFTTGTSAPSERMRIDSSGNLQVGGTTVANTTGYVNSRTNTRAWVNFAGATGTINSSYNVSSVTRNAAGTWTVAYTTALATSTYAVSVTAQPPGGTEFASGTNTFGIISPLSNAIQTGSVRVICEYGNALTGQDATSMSVICFGN